jgi:AcrR family transcriptional regulator
MVSYVTHGNIVSDPGVKRIRKRARDFHHGDLRAAAIEIAVREVEKRGHSDVTLEHVAARLGVTRPALYRHFADRRARRAEVAQRGYERFEESITTAFNAHAEDIWEAVHALGVAYIEFALANPGWFRLQFSHPMPRPDLERTPARYAPAMQAGLTERLGPADGMIAYRAAWGIAHGLAALVVEGLPRPYADALRLHVRALAAYATRA